MTISIHVSDPIWSYLPMDQTNDGLMNGWSWRISLRARNISITTNSSRAWKML